MAKITKRSGAGTIVLPGGQSLSTVGYGVQAGPPAMRSVLAYNSARFEDYYPGHMFLNLAKQMRSWFDSSGNNNDPTAAYQDTDGYYRAIPPGAPNVLTVLSWSSLPASVVTRYVLTYTGQGSLSLNGQVTVVSRETLANGERIYFDITANGNVQFIISDIPDSTNHPRDFVMLRDEPQWIADYNSGEMFTRAFKAHLMPNGLPLAEFRHLNTMFINNSTVRDFADLPTPTRAVYTDGVPLTILCRLARETGHVPYFCLPAQATDACVTQFASVVAAELPDLLPDIKVAYTNESWNSIFDQTNMCIYRGGALWGKGFAGGVQTVTASVIDIDPRVTVPDPTGLVVNDTIGFYDSTTRKHSHARITAINGTVLTMDRNIRMGTGQVSISAATKALNQEYHAKRSCEVMQLWEAATGVAPVRVMETHTVTSNGVSRARMQADLWRNSGDPSFVEPSSVHDALGITSYFYSTVDRQLDTMEAAFASSYEEGRDVVLTGMFDTKDAGFDEMEQRFVTQRAVADEYGLDLVLYEGLSPHDIFSNTDDEFASIYAGFVYSADFNPVWDAHFDLVRRFVDGPNMQYSDIVRRSRFGLWGLYEQMGVDNPRSSYILSKAAGLTRWWGDDVAPQLIGPDRLELTTNDTTAVDMAAFFTQNAATFTAVNLPNSYVLEPDGRLDPDSTAAADEVVVSTISAHTATGTVDDVAFTFDITYVDPIVLPPPDYQTSFADETGIDLRNGATVFGGDLIAEDDTQNQYGVLTDLKALLAAQPTDEITLSFECTIPAGGVFTNVPPVMSSTIFVEESRVRVRNDAGLQTVATGSPLLRADGVSRRITVTGSRTTGQFVAYIDGVKVGDTTLGGVIEPFDDQEFRFGASFSGFVPVRFHSVRMWRLFFTAEQEAAIDEI